MPRSNSIRDFIKLESSAGILLFVGAVLALLVDNSPWQSWYQAIFATKLTIQFGAFLLSKPLVLWINEGLMAVFFLLVSLEIKREVLIGELNGLSKISLSAFAAVGGMLVPALIYGAINHESALALRGWAIPTATDIAFSLGIIALLGSRVPTSLKLYLTALAIFDDLGAILIIAVYYSTSIALSSVICAATCILILCLLNYYRVMRLVPYMLVGIVLWVCVLKSGVHATFAGVILAFSVPLRNEKKPHRSPLRRLEKELHLWVAFFVLPLFAFANAGVSFSGMAWSAFLSPIALGIAAGLFIGKQVGIFGASWLAVQLGWAKLPYGSSWLSIYGIAVLCGVGFTMSLFIGMLAFNEVGLHYDVWVRLGVLSGSLVSGVLGYAVLAFSCKAKKGEAVAAPA